jgi:hypothetical protein
MPAGVGAAPSGGGRGSRSGGGRGGGGNTSARGGAYASVPGGALGGGGGGGTRRKKAAGSKSANLLKITPYPEMNVRSSGSSSYGVGPGGECLPRHMCHSIQERLGGYCTPSHPMHSYPRPLNPKASHDVASIVRQALLRGVLCRDRIQAQEDFLVLVQARRERRRGLRGTERCAGLLRLPGARRAGGMALQSFRFQLNYCIFERF